MPQIVEFLRIFSKPILLLVLPFSLVIWATIGRPTARRVGLVCAGALVIMSCYPIVAISILTVSAMTDEEPTFTVVPGLVYGGEYDSVTAVPGDYPLRLSYYNPALGGINCDHDCSTMASGDKTAWWVGGRPSAGSGTMYAAACPREWGWGHGTRFSVAGLDFECRDTGGWINCYVPGEYDPALKASAEFDYCWVDLMTPMSVAPYGMLTSDWTKE